MKLRTCKTIEEIHEDFNKPSIFAKTWETSEVEILLEQLSLSTGHEERYRKALEEIADTDIFPNGVMGYSDNMKMTERFRLIARAALSHPEEVREIGEVREELIKIFRRRGLLTYREVTDEILTVFDVKRRER